MVDVVAVPFTGEKRKNWEEMEKDFFI